MWGMNHFWHKLRILQAASQEYDCVLWTDFDVRQIKLLPDTFWNELSCGPCLRAPLYVLRMVYHWWTAWWRTEPSLRHLKTRDKSIAGTKTIEGERGRLAARLMPGGAYVYLRGKETADTLMQIRHEFPLFSDQCVMAVYLDRLYDGWMGAADYFHSRHNTVGYYHKVCLFPPTPDETVWQCGPIGDLPDEKYLSC